MADGRASYDLHLHTCWSYDGHTEPEDVFRIAREAGVATVAVADHHVADAFGELGAAAARYDDVRWIPAAELSVTTSFGGMDLLCLNLPAEPAGELAAVLEEYHEWQRARAAWSIEALGRLGVEFSEEVHDRLLASYRPGRTVELQGRTHLKNEVLRRHLIDEGAIEDEAGYWPLHGQMSRAAGPPPPYPAVGRVAPAVKAAGGLVVIAHPVGYFERDSRDRMDALCAECLLDGIECGHGSVPPEMRDFYRAYCREKGLLSTGGSDAHSAEMLAERIGLHGGGADWIEEVMDRIDG